MPVSNSYLICTSHRSGSNLLCEVLTKTGLAGTPQEYFYQGFYPHWFKTFGVTHFPDYLRQVVASTATPNGVFGAKLMGDQYFTDFVEQVRQLPRFQNTKPTTAEMLSDCFPNLTYIWLTRRNVVRQAISLSRAIQTGIWRAAQIPGQDPQKTIKYDLIDINNCILNITLQQTSWQEYFSRSGITPLTVVYEDFIEHPEAATGLILDRLGIAIPSAWAMGELQERKLADAVSEEWFQRYAQAWFEGRLQNSVQARQEKSRPWLQDSRCGRSLEGDERELERRMVMDYLTDENTSKHLPFSLIFKALRSRLTALLGLG
jgi:trehalose 2-sulfotransferase